MGNPPCICRETGHHPRLVVVTGGPGAGKTALLEIVQRHFCHHVQVLPESASLVYGGGFPRHATLAGRCAAQRAIFYVQRELERLVIDEGQASVVLCDRGTLDGLAYWPRTSAEFYSEVGLDRRAELARYAAVIHLRTPSNHEGYNHRNPLRIESPEEARLIDARIVEAWEGHPQRTFVESTGDFLDKVARALGLIEAQIPTCCGGTRAG